MNTSLKPQEGLIFKNIKKEVKTGRKGERLKSTSNNAKMVEDYSQGAE